MGRKKLIATLLGLGFLSTSYVAVSQTPSGLLAPFMVRRCTSITVGGSVKCNGITDRQMTLQDVERCIAQLNFPQCMGSTNAGPGAVQFAGDNPVLAFAGQFADADSLAAGVLSKNAEERLWDNDGLLHVIERSQKCSAAKMAQLRSSYCHCPH